jgi:hypothetical protein
LARQLRRTDVVLWAAAVAGFFAACKGFGTQWAWPNAFIPGVVFPAYAATVLVARLCAHGVASASIPAAVLASAAAAALAVQCVKVGAPLASSFVPAPGARAAAMRHLDVLRALPGDGFIPFHPYYSVLVGKRPFVHRMGVKDVEARFGRPAGLDEAVAAQRFPFVVLDDKVQPYEFPHMDGRYHVVEEIYDGAASVRMFSGAPTSPRYILLPTVDPPAAPPGGERLFDFEAGGFAGFTVDGDAFGASPAPARTGAYGRFAADSARFGPVALGTLRSPSINIHKPHLRFTLTGPRDANLRVALVDGPDIAISVGPDGTTRVVDLDVSGLVGKSVILQIEDRSTTGGLCVDEIVAW